MRLRLTLAVCGLVGAMAACDSAAGSGARESSPPAGVSGAPSRAPSTGPSGSGAPSPGDRNVTITAVGDIIMGAAPGTLPPDDARGFFAGVRSELRAGRSRPGGVVIGNLETPLTADTGVSKCGDAKGCFAFRVPPHYAQRLRQAGFTLVNIANNHTNDFGPAGLAATRGALRAAGVRHTGMPGQVTVQRVGSVRVAVLGMATYAWTHDALDIAGARRLVRRAAAMADVVVATMHVGAEGSDKTHVRPGTEMFLGENRGDPIALGHALVDAGADLVIGFSPHVLRGMEWYKGRLIAYSMGNFAGYRVLATTGPLGLGGILRVRLAADGGWAGGEFVPTRMDATGLPVGDPTGAATDLVRSLSREDFGPAAMRLGAKGVLRPPSAG